MVDDFVVVEEHIFTFTFQCMQGARIKEYISKHQSSSNESVLNF